VAFNCTNCFLGGADAALKGLTVGGDWVPHAEHEKARLSDAHSPAHALDSDLAGIIFVRGVYDFTVIVVVA